MFSSKPKEALPSGALPTAIPIAPAPPRRPARSSAPSILSADAVVTGTLTSVGDMQVDGRVEGDIRSVGLVIGEKAEIHGEIYAEEVTVRGRVIGRILARKVLLCATSHVEGDILHEAFAVESGAFFEGNCRHSDNPLGDAQPATPLAAIIPQQTVVSPAPRVQAPLPGQATFAPLST
jgi:cytoskeletal protein CcmA (bactofilin family)